MSKAFKTVGGFIQSEDETNNTTLGPEGEPPRIQRGAVLYRRFVRLLAFLVSAGSRSSLRFLYHAWIGRNSKAKHASPYSGAFRKETL